MNGKKVFIWVILSVIGIILMGCATQPNPTGTEKVSWSDYTLVPSKDYVVVGAVVVRGSSIRTLNADLMEKAIEIGAHNIINVRVDIEQDYSGKKIIAASAVAIKYTDVTLKVKSASATTTTTTTNGVSNTTTVNNESEGIFMGETGQATKAVTVTEPAKRKKFLGIF